MENEDLETLGYSLEMLQDDDTWLEVFDAGLDPDALSTTVTGLTTGKLYTFRAYSHNFNGKSAPSDLFSIYACGLPRFFDAPVYAASTQTSIAIRWTPPADDGGCPVNDYEIQRDADGTGTGTWTEVNPESSFQRYDPFLTEFTCETFPVGTVIGDEFKFRIVAYNLQGSATSVESRAIPLASVPGRPTNAPYSDSSETNGSQVRVVYDEVADDGGVPLLSYELQMSSILLTDWMQVVGTDPYSLQLYFTVTRGIVKGEPFQFRYRAINSIGVGPWSDLVQITAASVPVAPPKPYYISSTADSITVGLDATTDNGGLRIDDYVLYRDEGDLSSPVDVEVLSHGGLPGQHTITGLSAGVKYRFNYVAHNALGDSSRSLTLTVSASPLPDPPTDLVIDWDQSTRTSLMVEWSEPVVLPPSPILGYILEIDDGDGGQFFTAYDGSSRPGITYFLVSGLQNGGLYRFRAYSVNFNGISAASEVAEYFACTAPTDFNQPIIINQSSALFAITWDPPNDAGGCRITSYIVYRNDGLIGAVDTEVNEDNDSAVREKPSLSSFTITDFPANSEGNTFRIQIKVITTQREGLSDVAYAVLAGVPSKPTDTPVVDLAETNDTQIKVSFASPLPEHNGSGIISYELQMDDGFSGDFVSLIGYQSNSKLTTFLVEDLIIKGR